MAVYEVCREGGWEGGRVCLGGDMKSKKNTVYLTDCYD